MSEKCPACAKGKKERMTFCSRCYYRLPKDVRQSLYNLVGEGYEEAYDEAMKILGQKTQGAS